MLHAKLRRRHELGAVMRRRSMTAFKLLLAGLFWGKLHNTLDMYTPDYAEVVIHPLSI